MIEVTRPVAPGRRHHRRRRGRSRRGTARRRRTTLARRRARAARRRRRDVSARCTPDRGWRSSRPETRSCRHDTRKLAPGQVRDATASALAGLVADAGGIPIVAGIVPDEREALEARLADVLTYADLVVVSAGSSVGTRDETAGAVAAFGEIWCHGLAIKPGKPTLLAECGDGVPLIGLPGNPLSALVVFRLIGVPLLWRLAGCAQPPPEPSARPAPRP